MPRSPGEGQRMSKELSGRALLSAQLIVIVSVAWVAANVVAEVRPRVPAIWPKTVNADGVVGPLITCTGFATPAKLVITSPKVGEWPLQINMPATRREARVRLVAQTARLGESVDVVAADGPPRNLQSVPQQTCLLKHVTQSLRWVATAVQISFALLLLFRLRWSRESFGFYLFVLGFSPMTEGALNAVLPAWAVMGQNLLNDATEGAGLYGLMLFCEGLADAEIPVWRHVIAFMAFVATACAVTADLAFWIAGAPTVWLFLASQVVFAATASAVVVLIVVAAYPSSKEERRAQARWICSGIIVGIPLYLLGYTLDNIQNPSHAFPGYAIDALYAAIVLVPAAVWYGETRHHVMDVGLFISRGAFYGLLVYAGFGLLNMAAASAQTRLAHSRSLLLASVSILLAVCFSPLKAVVTGVVGRYVPRGRFENLRALRECARDLGACQTPIHLNRAIVTMASEALKIRCTALVCADGVVDAAHDYDDARHDEHLMALARDTRLRHALDDDNDAIRLHSWRFESVRRFKNDVQPLAAIVVDEPARPYQIFVAGPHVDGTDLDTEEIKGLQVFIGRAVACRMAMPARDVKACVDEPSSA